MNWTRIDDTTWVSDRHPRTGFRVTIQFDPRYGYSVEDCRYVYRTLHAAKIAASRTQHRRD